MRIALFYHSVLSDWNHGNAHFLRGVATELIERGHCVDIYEPRDNWSLRNLLQEHGPEAVGGFHAAYPRLRAHPYDLRELNLDHELAGVDLVIVHEWNDHELVRRIGAHHRRHGRYVLFFHDTHHRAVTAAGDMAAYELQHYDGVLAFGKVIRDIYLENRWTQSAWSWHEAADTRVFKPLPRTQTEGDLVWIGNWGDNERTAELHEFLLRPVKELRLKARVYGVRYPGHARRALADAGIEYAGWLPNYRAPEIFAKFKVTIHVPRRPYAKALPGIPTIRPFEALACGIPLVTAPWSDAEGLFAPELDFLVARNGGEMKQQLQSVLGNPLLADELSVRGRATLVQRHTCVHRVDELLAIYKEVRSERANKITVRREVAV